MTDGNGPRNEPRAAWWAAALLGQSAFVFAVVALSGPGRIDVVDGQTRYEAGRSLVDHGDMVIRDPHVTFAVFPGRDGQRYTKYRFPQTAAAVVAIVVADATGPADEARRHFFFTLTGAAACAALAVTYALWFRHRGLGPGAALFWSTAGVFCTPSWFYGTSTFDDVLGSAALVVAFVTAYTLRDRRPWLGAAGAGLALGLALNCKEPLGVFVLPALAAVYDPGRPLRAQAGRFALVLAGVALGAAAYVGLDLYKYPPGRTPSHAELWQHYPPTFGGDPAAAWLGLTVSPGVGALWYCPTLLLSLAGLGAWYGRAKGFFWAVVAASVVFIAFLCSLTYFGGDPAWGPRYLTPLFAVLWLFTPDGAARLRPGTAASSGWLVPLLLTLGLVVQLAALAVDPHRLYIEQGMPSAFYLQKPWLYFHPAASHLLNRPREIAEVLAPDRPRAEAFTPAPTPTFAFPVINQLSQEPGSIRRYHVLNAPRPWWVSQRYLPPAERPVDLGRTALLLLALAGAGLAALLAGARRLGRTADRSATRAAAGRSWEGVPP